MKLHPVAAVLGCSAILASLGPVTTLAGTPSFNCAGAKTPSEESICADERLARLDVRLNEIYRTKHDALSGDARGQFAKAQRDWLAERNSKCDTSSARTECLADLMRERIRLLTQPLVVGNVGQSPHKESPSQPPQTGARVAVTDTYYSVADDPGCNITWKPNGNIYYEGCNNWDIVAASKSSKDSESKDEPNTSYWHFIRINGQSCDGSILRIGNRLNVKPWECSRDFTLIER
jgi:uncharacterized protein